MSSCAWIKIFYWRRAIYYPVAAACCSALGALFQSSKPNFYEPQ